MSVKGIAIAMVAGAGLVIFLGTRGHHDDEPPPPPPPKAGPQWIAKEAVAELVTANGEPGPLFDGLALGGAVPTDAQRARIDEFKKKNDVDIELDVAGDKLTAIRFGVTFKGGFGLEGADVFALRLKRPSTGHCCVCGSDTWIDSWAYTLDDGVRVRARVKTSRVEVRWERAATFAELVATADELLGKEVVQTREAAGDRWHELGGVHLLEAAMPYPRGSPNDYRSDGSDLGFRLEDQGGKIVQIRLVMDDLQGDHSKEIGKLARERWGPPHADGDDHWTWKRHDRFVEIESMSSGPRLLVRHPGYTTGLPF